MDIPAALVGFLFLVLIIAAAALIVVLLFGRLAARRARSYERACRLAVLNVMAAATDLETFSEQDPRLVEAIYKVREPFLIGESWITSTNGHRLPSTLMLLEMDGYVAPARSVSVDPNAPSNQRYRLTRQGRDWLAQHLAA